ncbi:formate dehydrogenase accessory sulfurtransferase FdhD [Alteromonas lipolytica]|uniref:Sulfur carrier protein FdhD n=1 Tax=Alteromonas lipolytica TaxID=1856405 RepID=A0A1E8FDZ8_9ALTE|nr:formate dehydrogenase accessory sulfurtransferase FdhD [Alteromonas lipolytica]OFI34154.1 formate dehydrogenase family accessory protein FdhD [Alteromonas lipolytica]GGF64941.1 sulfurtransferase FdhD [Alteromonas lipolytica]
MADRHDTASVYGFQTLESDAHEDNAAIPTECALAISYNQINYAVMMVSPNDLQDFVTGFSLTQGIIDAPEQFRSITITLEQQQGTAEIELSARAQFQLTKQQRQMAGSSGCGICGVDALESALPELAVLPPTAIPAYTAFNQLRDRIRDFQHALHSSGAQHAAFFILNDGTITHCREDIGRHNAMDKLIGALVRKKADLQSGFMVLTSRCGLELVQKAIRAGISTLVTLSAPTTLAVEWARRYQLNLIHVPHHNAPRIYHRSDIPG